MDSETNNNAMSKETECLLNEVLYSICEDLDVEMAILLRSKHRPFTWYRTAMAYVMCIDLDMRRVDAGKILGFKHHSTICDNVTYCRERLPYDKDYIRLYKHIKKYFKHLIERKNDTSS